MMILNRKISFKQWFKIGCWATLFLLLASIYVIWELIKPASGGDDLINFQIEEGSTVNVISVKLYEAQVIKNKFWFETWVWLTGSEKKILMGHYSVPADINLLNLVKIISGGVVPNNEMEITIIEGWTIGKINNYLKEKGVVTDDSFKVTAGTGEVASEISNQLQNSLLDSKPGQLGLEGYLFPDTYRIFNNTSAEDIIFKMVKNLSNKLSPDLVKLLKNKGLSIHEALTLASIIELEVPSENDRALVADIFLRRLDNNIGLQADSTINYITGQSKPSVSLDDIKINSPYNTYKYKGLPPGPICNPGLSAIKAVVYPQPNDYWYFLTTPDGRVIYSKTFEQHKQAKYKYLK